MNNENFHFDLLIYLITFKISSYIRRTSSGTSWIHKVLERNCKSNFKRKIRESLFIEEHKPDLNVQKDAYRQKFRYQSKVFRINYVPDEGISFAPRNSLFSTNSAFWAFHSIKTGEVGRVVRKKALLTIPALDQVLLSEIAELGEVFLTNFRQNSYHLEKMPLHSRLSLITTPLFRGLTCFSLNRQECIRFSVSKRLFFSHHFSNQTIQEKRPAINPFNLFNPAQDPDCSD